MRLELISPVLILLAGAVVVLVIGIFLPRHRQTWCAWLTCLVVVVAAAAVIVRLGGPFQLVFDGSFAVDPPALWTALALLVGALLSILLAVAEFRRDAREAEFYVLLLFALLGAVLLAGAADLMEILLGVLLTSVAAYALVAWRRGDPLAMEAVLKYYLVGALANIGLIFGLVLLFGLSGGTLLSDLGAISGSRIALAVALTLAVAGLGFKAGYVPGHFWIPDVYQGATVPVAALLSVLPKVAAVLALGRLLDAMPEAVDWPPLVAGIAAVTMTWGNLAAFWQQDVRRLLAYSSIAQTGYVLLAVTALPGSALAVPGLLYYFFAYTVANVGAFAVLSATGRHTVAGNAGLLRQRPWLAFAMLFCLMSLLGLPPLAGFVGKFLVFAAAMEAGYVWLAVVALVNTVLSLFYYLRVVNPMFLQPPAQAAESPNPLGTAVAVAGAAATLLLGVGGLWLLDWERPLELLP